MQAVLTNLAVSMSDFKKNPAKVLREAGDEPVAVLSHNKPAFYMIPPEVYEEMIEKLADIELLPLLNERLARADKAVEVDINDL